MSTSERIEGPTPAGGAYLIAQYSARDGSPATKANAYNAEVTEYAADGTELSRTYAVLREDRKGSFEVARRRR